MAMRRGPLLLLAVAAFVVLGMLFVTEPPVCGQMSAFSSVKEADPSGWCFLGNDPTCPPKAH